MYNLQFQTVLITPLLEGDDRRFSGYNGVGINNQDELGKIIDAYAHSIHVHSEGTIVLADLQGNIIFLISNLLNVCLGTIHNNGSITLYDPQAHR